MRISDWSSDVCSSDLRGGAETPPRLDFAGAAPSAHWLQPCRPVTRANGAIGYGVGNAIQRQPRNPGAIQRGSLMPGLRRLAATAALLVLCPMAALAADARTQLKSFVAEIKSATGSFSQSTTGPQGRAQRPQSGTFAFQRPGKFKGAVHQPYAQLVVSDGQQLGWGERRGGKGCGRTCRSGG